MPLASSLTGALTWSLTATATATGLAAQLCQHRNEPCKKLGRLTMLDFVKATEGTSDVEYSGALHGGAARDCIVSSRVGL